MMVGSNPVKGIQDFQVFLTEPQQNGGKFESVYFMLRDIYIQKAYFKSTLEDICFFVIRQKKII